MSCYAKLVDMTFLWVLFVLYLGGLFIYLMSQEHLYFAFIFFFSFGHIVRMTVTSGVIFL